MDVYQVHFTRKVWICVLSLLILLDCYFHVYVYYNVLQNPERSNVYDAYEGIKNQGDDIAYYKYPLINEEEVPMDYKNYYSSFYWFQTIKHMFKNISAVAPPVYAIDTPMCELNTTLGPISVNKSEPKLEWIEEQNSDVKLGGYYEPAHCRATQRVAVIVPYRDRRTSLHILLRYLHPLLKKQLLEYRIFLVQQFGSEKFNKGTLYNIAFLESQRFGNWHCLIFHDLDLIPEDERIPYSCSDQPTLMAPGKGSTGFGLGTVMAVTPDHYQDAMGYSNLYWDWGAEDDDFYNNLSKNYEVVKLNSSEAPYATLSQPIRDVGKNRKFLLAKSSLFDREGLTSTKYNLVKVVQEKLYTHILAEVNPMNIGIETKTVMRRLINLRINNTQSNTVSRKS